MVLPPPALAARYISPTDSLTENGYDVASRADEVYNYEEKIITELENIQVGLRRLKGRNG